MDLSAAFNTVDYDVLLKRLEATHGINGAPLNWMKSYIANQVLVIVVNSSKSSMVRLSCGVPQG